MPPRRQRRAQPVLYVSSPTQRTKLPFPIVFPTSSVLRPESTPPLSPALQLPSPPTSPPPSPPASMSEPLTIALDDSATTNLKTPMKRNTIAEDDSVDANPPNSGNVLAGYGTRNGEMSIAPVSVLNSNNAIGHTLSGDNKVFSAEGPTNSPNNALNVSSPNPPQDVKANTLGEAIRKTREMVAAHQPSPWLTSPMPPMMWTGLPIVDHVMNDVRRSEYALWPGTPHPGDATLAVVGMVSAEGLNAGPDAGWQPAWGEEKLHKQKRSFRIIDPGVASNIPSIWCGTQLGGALRIVEAACTPSKTGSHGPNRAVQDNDEDDAQSNASSEDELPEGCEFGTWNLSSEGVRGAFSRVMERGFQPVALPAYTRFNKPIHPNNVNGVLSGALVLAYFTLERMRFSKDKGQRTEYQFYANLLKVQVLKLAPVKPTVTKRKFVHSYGPSDNFGSGDRSSDGSAPAKKLNLVLSAE
ncbi:hypothetical protein FRC07_011298 [Ceratobasidium sp. 392]|nr:hypothetical protein FRC07_011298 [Ceratobasidium sp. 392]